MKNIYIEDCRKLISILSHIEERHLLELCAVWSGLKRVMRIHVSSDTEYVEIMKFCQKHNLSVAHSKFKLKLCWSNNLGDSFYEDVPWDEETNGEFVAYISKEDNSVLQKATGIEIEESHLEAGLLYDYPECCSINYEKIAHGEDWISVLSKNSSGLYFPLWTNKLAYLVYGFTLFPDYFPCSYNCTNTSELSKQYYNLGIQFGLKDFVEMQKRLMTGVYLVSDHNVVACHDYSINCGNELSISNDQIKMTNNAKKLGFNNEIKNVCLQTDDLSSHVKIGTDRYRIFIFQ